jgi:5-methylthioribose kinase
VASNNRWTSPQLDSDKKSLETDTALRLAVAKLKNRFITETQALLHADLHSGSVMCAPSPGQTFVIDPEFAFYGPMAFDTGFFIANLLLNYVSQPAHADVDEDTGYGEWILQQVKIFWTTFESTFTEQWNDASQHTGYMFERSSFPSEEDHKIVQGEWFATMLSDSLAFAGCEMIRRIVGIAHVEDLESIADADLRARCERHGLEIAKVFIMEPERFSSIDHAVELAKSVKA